MVANLKDPVKGVVLTHNYTPTYLIGFASNFGKNLVVLTQSYNYEKDPIFDIKNPADAEEEATYIKGIIHNAPKLHLKIINGDTIKKGDLYYNPNEYHIHEVIVKYDPGIDIVEYIHAMDNFPALVLDATSFDVNHKIVQYGDLTLNQLSGINSRINYPKTKRINLSTQKNKKKHKNRINTSFEDSM